MEEAYYCEVVFKSGQFTTLWLSEGTWVHWGGRVACNKDNPFAKGQVLAGLNHINNPVCLRTSEIVSINFGSFKYKIADATQTNPLNEDDHYDNPLS